MAGGVFLAATEGMEVFLPRVDSVFRMMLRSEPALPVADPALPAADPAIRMFFFLHTREMGGL